METWKDIEGFEGIYQVSNSGQVKSLKRKWRLSEIILKSGKDTYGYNIVILHKNGKRRTRTIHSLVWDAFGDRKRNGRKLQIDHIDNNKRNNKIENLQLLTHRKNSSKSVKLKKRNNYPTGVYKYYGKFQSQIWINGKKKHLGSCSTPEAAAELYQDALKELDE